MIEIARALARAARIGAVTLGVLSVCGLVIFHAPDFLVRQDVLMQVAPEHRLLAEHNARLMSVSALGALAVAFGLVYTARNYRLTHRGQATERFTKALERLGADELYIRVGGVHALEHLMRDSPAHHGDVVEVLLALVRDRAPRTTPGSVGEVQWQQWSQSQSAAKKPDDVPTEPAPDVQAALTALGNRPLRTKHERGALNLRQLYLRGAHLEGAQFKGVDLRETNLQDADLSKANLRNADLWLVNLKNADLDKADLRKARLNGGADLEEANFGQAKLQGANLVNANLLHANLSRANLKGAQLAGANLRQMSLNEANLRGACLAKVDLFQTHLDGSNLRKTDFSAADMSMAFVTADQLRQAVLSEETVLPEGLTRGPLGEIREKNLPETPPRPNADQREPMS